MTLAICIRCGSEKFGALTACLNCHFTPEFPDDQAKSMMLSSHFLNRQALSSASEQIRSGKAIEFDPTAVAGWAQTIREHPEDATIPFGWRIALNSPIVIMIVLLIAFICLCVFAVWIRW